MLAALPSFLLPHLALLPLALSSPDLTATPQHNAIPRDTADLGRRAFWFRPLNKPKPDAPEVVPTAPIEITPSADSPASDPTATCEYLHAGIPCVTSEPSTSYYPYLSSKPYPTKSLAEPQFVDGPYAMGTASIATSSSNSTTAAVAATTSTAAIAGIEFTGAAPMLAARRANSALAMWSGISSLCLLA